MNSMHNDSQISPAVTLGIHIREARKKCGLTISEFADKMGRPREWLNRIELGYSEYGEYKPLSRTELHTITELIGECFTVSQDTLVELCETAHEEYLSHKGNAAKQRRNSYGKLTQTEVIVGERQIVDAIVGLINEQHSDAIIRNTGIKSLGNYQQLTQDWKQYRLALGEFLNKNPNSLFKRIEYAATPEQLQSAQDADAKLAGDRKLTSVHNAKVKFRVENPLQLHVVIGQREAIMALPQTSGQAGSNIALLIRDKVFVEALRVWYDEVLWDGPSASQNINFATFDESFDAVRAMYGFTK